MNDTNLASHHRCGPKMPFDGGARRAGESTWNRSTGRVRHLFDTADYPPLKTPAAWQVREEKGFYIPDLLADEQYDCKPEYFSAACDHAKLLTEAQLLLGEALNMVRLTSAALSEAGDRRAMQTETACNVIEEKLSKAYDRIDKHDRRHTNLFLAYFDLRGNPEGGESG